MIHVTQFNTAILSVGQHVKISGMSQDYWYFEHNGVIKAIEAAKLIITYEDRLTKQAVDYPISIEDVIKGRISIQKSPY